MKPLLKLLISILLVSCSTSKKVSNVSSFEGRYDAFLEEDETLIKNWYHYVTSRKGGEQYIKRTFHPEKNQITAFETYASNTFEIKDGKAKYWFDDGSISEEGVYKNDLKTGRWISYYFEINTKRSEGEYKLGKKEGTWKELDSKGRLMSEVMWMDGKKNGDFISYDTLGNISNQGLYRADTVYSQSKAPIVDKTKVSSYLISVACKGIEDIDKRKACADRELLEIIYGNITYPKKARDLGVQGTALISFTIDRDGNIKNPHILSGLCESIENVCMGIVKGLPRWQPGIRKGEKVEEKITLPIRFILPTI